jgi:hypothetical protein
MTKFEDKLYDAFPLQIHKPNVQTVLKCEKLLESIIAHESFFTDYTKACDDACGDCPQCQRTKLIVSAKIQNPSSLNWEVWSKDPETGQYLDFVGILRLSNVSPGCDATAHYFFFDGKLRDKTTLLEQWADWAFTDKSNWKGLKRVTIEIPSHAFALARHAVKHLQFGGPFEYRHNNVTIPVEGIREQAVLWRGQWHDLLILGRLNHG